MRFSPCAIPVWKHRVLRTLASGSRLSVPLLLLVMPPASAGADLPSPAELPGPLVLASGRDVPNDIRDAFFALAGKEKAKIVVIPTAIATADDPKTQEEVLKLWADLKPASVEVLHTRDRKKADDPEFVKPL